MENPYPGLRSFEPRESHFFFGREESIDELESRISVSPFLAITGASGSGKSSLIKAGFLPKIAHKDVGVLKKNKRFILFKPGVSPFDNFLQEFYKDDQITKEGNPINVHYSEAKNVLLNKGLQAFLSLVGYGNMLLVIIVDQFEELLKFNATNNDAKGEYEQAVKFIDFMTTSLDNDSGFNLRVIITMRSDFLGDCAPHKRLTEYINEGHYLIPDMDKYQCIRAIKNPSKYYGVEIEDTIVDRIFNEVHSGHDQLPLLQHVMLRVWKYWVGLSKVTENRIREHHYKAVGGVEKALLLHAEEAFNELGSSERKKVAEKIFKALTEVNSDGKGIRKPSSLGDIVALVQLPVESIAKVIDIFRRPDVAFIFPTSDVVADLGTSTILDISHESLMRKWNRLKFWVEDEAKSADIYIRLAENSVLYKNAKVGLITNPELDIAMNWRKKSNPNVFWARRYSPDFERAMTYLDQSYSDYTLTQEQKEHYRLLELRTAKRFTIILSVIGVFLVLLFVIATNQYFEALDSGKKALLKSDEAEKQTEIADEATMNAISQKRISEQKSEIAFEQKLIADGEREIAEKQKIVAQEQQAIAQYQKNVADSQKNLAVEAKYIAVEQEKIAKTQRERAEESEKNIKRLRMLSISDNLAVQSMNLWTSDKLTAQILAKHAYEFNINNGGDLNDPGVYQSLSLVSDNEKTYKGHTDAVRDIHVNNGVVFTAGEDGRILKWKNQTDCIAQNTTNNFSDPIRSIDVSATENIAYIYSGQLNLVKAGGKVPFYVSPLNEEPLSKVAFERTGQNIFVTAENTKKLSVVSCENMQEINAVTFESRIILWTLSEDRKTIIVLEENNKISVLDEKLNIIIKVNSVSNNDAVSFLAVGDGCEFIVEGMSSGELIVLDKEGNLVKILSGHISGITDLLIITNKQLLVSASYDGRVTMWDLQDLEKEPALIGEIDTWVLSLAYDHDNEKVFAGGQDRLMRSWNINQKKLANKLCDGIGDENLSKADWNSYIGNDIPKEDVCK